MISILSDEKVAVYSSRIAMSVSDPTGWQVSWAGLKIMYRVHAHVVAKASLLNRGSHLDPSGTAELRAGVIRAMSISSVIRCWSRGCPMGFGGPCVSCFEIAHAKLWQQKSSSLNCRPLSRGRYCYMGSSISNRTFGDIFPDP